jgi:hypothetical protein
MGMSRETQLALERQRMTIEASIAEALLEAKEQAWAEGFRAAGDHYLAYQGWEEIRVGEEPEVPVNPYSLEAQAESALEVTDERIEEWMRGEA